MRLKLTQSRSGLILSAVEATEEKAKIFSDGDASPASEAETN